MSECLNNYDFFSDKSVSILFFIVWLIPIYASLAIVEFWYEIYIFFLSNR